MSLVTYKSFVSLLWVKLLEARFFLNWILNFYTTYHRQSSCQGFARFRCSWVYFSRSFCEIYHCFYCVGCCCCCRHCRFDCCCCCYFRCYSCPIGCCAFSHFYSTSCKSCKQASEWAERFCMHSWMQTVCFCLEKCNS